MATIHCHVQIEQGLEQLGIQAATPCTPGGGGGEANVGANVGIGEGLVYEGKDGVVLNFRTLKAGPNMTISTNVVDKVIEINSILGGGNVTGPDPSTTRAIATYEDATGQILLNNKLKIDTARLGASLPLRSLLALDDEGSPAWHDLIRLEFVSEGFTAGLATIVGDTDTDAILVASADPWISTPTGDGKIIHTQIADPWIVEKSGGIFLPTEPDTIPIFRFGTGGTNGGYIDTFAGNQNPQGAVFATMGSLYFRSDGVNSELYQHKGAAGSNSDWVLVGGGGAGDFSTSVGAVIDETVLIFDGTTGKLGKSSPVRIEDVTAFHRIQIIEPAAPNAWKDAIQIGNLSAGGGLDAGQYVLVGNLLNPIDLLSSADPMCRVVGADASKVIHEKVTAGWDIENAGQVSTADADTTPPFSVEAKGSFGAQSRTFVGTRNPVAIVTGNPGDFYKRSNGENSRLYQHRGAVQNNLDWQEIAAGGGGNASNVWSFSTSTGDADPGAKKFRLNNVTASAATQTFIHYIADDNTDMKFIISKLAAGDAVYIQEQANHAIYHAYEVTGAVVDATTYAKIPLSWSSGSGVFTNNRKYSIAFLFSGGGGGAAPNVGFYATGPSQTLLNTTKTLVNFDGVRDDPGGDFSTSTNLFTAPTAGRYVLTGTLQITTNPGSVAHLGIETSVHGGVGIDYAYVPNAGTLILNVATTIYMDAGETAGLYAQQFSGFTATIQAAEKTLNGTQIMAV